MLAVVYLWSSHSFVQHLVYHLVHGRHIDLCIISVVKIYLYFVRVIRASECLTETSVRESVCMPKLSTSCIH